MNDEFSDDGRKFTPDGHMVGSLGEVVAAYAFDLELLPVGTPVHDAKSPEGKLVQIKLTGGKSGIGLTGKPEHLVVLQLKGNRRFEVVYNGPGAAVWKKRGNKQKNGQWRITLRTLRKLDAKANVRVRQVRDFP